MHDESSYFAQRYLVTITDFTLQFRYASQLPEAILACSSSTSPAFVMSTPRSLKRGVAVGITFLPPSTQIIPRNVILCDGLG